MLDFDAKDDEVYDALSSASVIAVVGASANPSRPSHYVAQFLKSKGKRMIAVNPGLAGQEMFGEPVYGSLSDIPEDYSVEMVDIFRRADAVPAIVDEALEKLPKLRVIWMQLGIRHPESARKAREAGKIVVQNRCPKIEYPRLIGLS